MPPQKRNGEMNTLERFADPEPANYHEELTDEFYVELNKKLGCDAADGSNIVTTESPAW